MKHISLFESWHDQTTCTHCNGTGLVGPTKKQSIEKVIRDILNKTKNSNDFMEYLGDDEFREHVIEVLKERGVHSLDMARMVAAIKMNQEDLQKVISETIDGYEAMEEIIRDGHITDKSKLDGIKKALALKSEVLDILRK
jgi:ubiquinone/menaquinone biosynthesis C-methylase UbiE